jgi:DNA-binding NtrC family response regulator/tetratricopeptide (TPR) repeat protein
MRDPMRSETSIQGRQFPRDGTEHGDTEEQVDLGDLCLSVGNLSDALAYYKDALGKVPSGSAAARRDIILKVVDCLRRQSKHEDALCFLMDVMTGFAGTERRDLLAEKATLLCLLGRYGEATEVCASVKTEEHTGARKGDARIYLVLGHVLLRVCKWKDAVRCFEQAATFARMCDDLTCLGNAFNNLGIGYKNLCRFDISLSYLEKAVGVARREKNDASLAVRLLNLANTAYKTGSVKKARRVIIEAIGIAESLNLGRLRVLGFITRARIEMLDLEFARARDLLAEAIEKAESLEDPRASAVAHETLGELLTRTGDFSGAQSVLDKCADGAPSECRDVEAEVKSRIADLHLARGDVEAARHTAEAAMAIAERIGDRFEVARCRRTIALTHRDPTRRVAGLKQAESLFRRIGSMAEASVTAHQIARSCRSAGGSAGGETAGYLERALAGFESCGILAGMTSVLCDLAEVSVETGRHEAALGYMEWMEDLAGPDAIDDIAREVRSRIDAGLSSALAETSVTLPGSPHEAYTLLSSTAGISGLALAETKDGAAASIVEAFGLDPDRALALAARVAGDLSSTTFISDVGITWRGLGGPDVRSLLAMPVKGKGASGILLVTWDRPVGAGSGAHAASIMKADYECRRVLPVLSSALVRRDEAHLPICMCGIVSGDIRMKELLLSLSRISESPCNVLITGETGTGKELVAKAIHMLSKRADGPFVAQNCAALPEHLLESEMFGHQSGAFTGARGEKRGLLEAADGGIFFLDEVGDVSPVIQAKMLRAIEAGEIRRVGDTVSRTIDVRFLSATNRRLDEEVAQGRMRQDLYYRLNVVSVSLPPLRERDGDIRLLAGLFLKRFSSRMAKQITRIEDDAMNALAGYDWPGNVRQLENEIERAVTLTRAGEPVRRPVMSACVSGQGDDTGRSTLRAEMRTVERRRILAALRQHRWNKTHAARALGDISRPALIAKMKKLGIPLKATGERA